MTTEEQKIAEFKKVNEPRTHKVTGSLGVYDAYKYIRKNKWFDIGMPITEHQFYSIVRTINQSLADDLLASKVVNFPCNMGNIEIRKFPYRIDFVDGKLKTNLPIDWDRTLKLWVEDEECLRNKTLVRIEQKESFNVKYDRRYAYYDNQEYYQFKVHRDIKQRILRKLRNNELDAFLL